MKVRTLVCLALMAAPICAFGWEPHGFVEVNGEVRVETWRTTTTVEGIYYTHLSGPRELNRGPDNVWFRLGESSADICVATLASVAPTGDPPVPGLVWAGATLDPNTKFLVAHALLAKATGQQLTFVVYGHNCRIAVMYD